MSSNEYYDSETTPTSTPNSIKLGSFYLRKTGEIRTTYEIFLLLEGPVHIINLILILVMPFYLFSHRVLLHKNLKVIILSYLLTAFFLSLSRLSWLICELFWVPTNIMEILMYFRFIFTSSSGAHLCVLSAERVTATVKSKKYEKESCYLLIVIFCFLTYPYSLLLLYSKYHFIHGRELNVLAIVIISAIALTAIAINYFINKKRVRDRRFKAHISEAYQMRENIRTSSLLLKVYIASALFLGLSCYFLLRFSATMADPEKTWETITNGFIYDMVVAVGATIGTFIFFQHVTQFSFRQKLSALFNLSKPKNDQVAPNTRLTKFKSVHGGDVEIGNQSVDKETGVYFSQLSKAWG